MLNTRRAIIYTNDGYGYWWIYTPQDRDFLWPYNSYLWIRVHQLSIARWGSVVMLRNMSQAHVIFIVTVHPPFLNDRRTGFMKYWYCYNKQAHSMIAFIEPRWITTSERVYVAHTRIELKFHMSHRLLRTPENIDWLGLFCWQQSAWFSHARFVKPIPHFIGWNHAVFFHFSDRLIINETLYLLLESSRLFFPCYPIDSISILGIISILGVMTWRQKILRFENKAPPPPPPPNPFWSLK